MTYTGDNGKTAESNMRRWNKKNYKEGKEKTFRMI